ncbi:DNA-3-methyladenine glycosylase [Nostocoides sp. HKS02]|nr:DNA-3-methyladenine glycosylase [Tetrasphaera sp. HKS02]
MSGSRLGREFFAEDVLDVAPALLGCTVTHAGVTVRLTEVEAYAGLADPGSHAFRGPTPRTQVMFGPAGHLYVYFTYGMHWCANVVCGSTGEASAVLLRAGEVVGGEEVAALRRAGIARRDWARGPARLATTLALRGEQSGLDACMPHGPVEFHLPPQRATARRVRTGPRVGVAGLGGDAAAYPWRFWLDGEPTVSPYRPAKPRAPKPTR